MVLANMMESHVPKFQHSTSGVGFQMIERCMKGHLKMIRSPGAFQIVHHHRKETDGPECVTIGVESIIVIAATEGKAIVHAGACQRWLLDARCLPSIT